MTPLSPLQLAALRALLDRLIPADGFPGALEAGTENYLLCQLAGDCAAEAPALAAGLTQLDAEAAARHGDASDAERGTEVADGTEVAAAKTFALLSPAQQDTLLRDLEAGRAATTWPPGLGCAAFFNRLVDLAHEGFYADSANDGNRSAVSWTMLGYAPRPTQPPRA